MCDIGRATSATSASADLATSARSARAAVTTTGRARARSSWRCSSSAGDYEIVLALTVPPDLDGTRPVVVKPETSPEQKMANLFGSNGCAVKNQKEVGIRGSQHRTRASNIEALALGGSTPADGVDPKLMRLVFGLCFLTWNETLHRMVLDRRWCDAFCRAGAAAAAGGGRVCVLGLGSAVAALEAARRGASLVLWAERVTRFKEVADALVARNGASRVVRTGRVRQWAELREPGGAAGSFDAVITEEIDDDLLGDGLLAMARHAHTHLLRPGGSFSPARARVFAAIATVRVEEISGFDLRGFNAFRSNEQGWVDLEHIAATDAFRRQGARLLSAPVRLFDFDFSSGEALPPDAREAELFAEVSEPGLLNCVLSWFELEVAAGVPTIDLGPLRRASKLLPAPLPFTERAKRQQLRFLGYERAVRPGERVRLVARHGATSLEVEVPADAAAEAAGSLVLWPTVNTLAYHFPMIADEGRNGAFDRALRAATREHVQRHGRPPRVLDIGSGSGLLAMMAARAGCTEVHSLEMVPQLAAAARHIVSANGHAQSITIHGVMSTELEPAAIGGKVDLLVCEIVDDGLLGEGVLTTIADARRRLLTPQPTIIPCGAAVFALAVELRVGKVCGFDLDDLNLFATDMALAPRAHAGCKLQEQPPSSYRALAPPLRLFDWDFVRTPLEQLTRGRQRDLMLEIGSDGVLSALVVYFSLHCDEDPAQWYSSGPDNAQLVAWDQSVRTLPVELRVRAGQRIKAVAYHDEKLVGIGLPDVSPEMLEGAVGHLEAMRQMP